MSYFIFITPNIVVPSYKSCPKSQKKRKKKKKLLLTEIFPCKQKNKESKNKNIPKKIKIKEKSLKPYPKFSLYIFNFLIHDPKKENNNKKTLNKIFVLWFILEERG